MNPESLFSLNDHLERLSRDGDPLEVLERTVDFDYFRRWTPSSQTVFAGVHLHNPSRSTHRLILRSLRA
jgi:hypothetical protein